MRRSVLLALAVVVFSTGFAAAGKLDSGRIPFTDFLRTAGDKLDCYFTIEATFGALTLNTRFDDLTIRDEKIASIDGLIAKLKRDIPDADVVRDGNSFRIIHVIEKGLAGHKRYALDEEASLDYSGLLRNLPNVLRDAGRAIWAWNSGILDDLSGDAVTKVDVHIPKEKIRKLLTDSVPLKKYGRVLWTAKTRINRGRLGTEVAYGGPKQATASAQNMGAVVEISVPAECNSDRPIPVSVVIRNVNSKPFECESVAGLPNDRMQMKLVNRDTKAPVAMSQRGMIYMESVAHGGQVGLERLEKGKSFGREIDLGQFFPTRPGRYAFTATFVLHRESDWHDIPITVGPVDFVVAK